MWKRMIKKTGVLMLCFVLVSSILPMNGFEVYAMSGSGTSADPYMIATCTDLQNMNLNLSAYYKLGNDIDCSDTVNWNAGAGFNPVGTFSGSLDGAGHVISNLYINRPSQSGVGLFSTIRYSNYIRNLTLKNVNITGNGETAGLSGQIIGLTTTIQNVAISGSVTGTNYTALVTGWASAVTSLNFSQISTSGYVSGAWYEGGLIGRDDGISISDSYSTAYVKGQSFAGGLVGWANYGSTNTNLIQRVYSTGYVENSSYGNISIGPLYGLETTTAINNTKSAYWDINTSSFPTAPEGTGETTGNMQLQSTYANYDFTNIWAINPSINNGYPYLKNNATPMSIIVTDDQPTYINLQWSVIPSASTYQLYKDGTLIYGGTNTNYSDAGVNYSENHSYKVVAEDGLGNEIDHSIVTPKVKDVSMKGKGTYIYPYQITNLNELQQMNQALSGTYELENDIDASATTTWNSGAGFNPVGTGRSTSFIGKFDGKNHTISNLYINRPTQYYIGLFGSDWYGDNVENIRLENVNFTGSNFTGGLFGFLSYYNTSNVLKNVSVTGKITCGTECGMLIGQLSDANIYQTYANGYVSGGNDVGGLIGRIYDAGIKDSYSSTYTKGNQNIGGLVGYLDNSGTSTKTIEETYSNGYVENNKYGDYNGGGMFGSVNLGTNGVIKNSYWDSQTSGWSYSPYGTGETTTNMKVQSTFNNFDFTNVWGMSTNTNNGYPYLVNTAPKLSISVTKNSTAEIQLNWSNVTNASTYELIKNGTLAYAGSNQSYDDTSVVSNISYTYQVNAKDSLGNILQQTTIQVTSKAFDMTGHGLRFDPFQITNVNDLQNMNVAKSAFFKIMNNIDASSTSTWNTGAGFLPVGDNTNNFTGSLDGNGKIVSNLTINRPTSNYIGLIGYAKPSSSNGGVFNLGLENVSITGNNYVGSFFGYYYGNGAVNLNSDYSTGQITGHSIVGGFGGNYDNLGEVDNSYSMANVNTNFQNTGGFLGQLSANVTLKNVYSSGKVKCTTSCSNIGGLLGLNYGITNNSYWDMNTSGQSTSASGVGETTAQMNTQSTYSTWNFTNIWGINPRVNNGYPYLRTFVTDKTPPSEVNNLSYTSSHSYVVLNWTNPSDSDYYMTNIYRNNNLITSTSSNTFTDTGLTDSTNYQYKITTVDVYGNESAGTILNAATNTLGTSSNPYIIMNCTDLQNVNLDLKGYYQLGTDIDCTNTVNWNAGQGFMPIGNTTNGFNGTFDGVGHSISNVYINRTTSYIGLIGYANHAIIENLSIHNANINGNGYVGILAGQTDGSTISNVQTNGTLSSTGYYNGGMVGQITFGSLLKNSSSSSTVTAPGEYYNGGLLGRVADSTVSNSYATGNITGKYATVSGGLIGIIDTSTVQNSYATGSLSGPVQSEAGGLGGEINNSIISGSYATGNITGMNTEYGGFAGKVYNSALNNDYSFGSVQGISMLGGFVGYVSSMNGTESISNNYSAGLVTGSSSIGGFAGSIASGYESYIHDNYWDMNTSGQNTSASGTGETTAQMNTKTTYYGWDFANTWGINPNVNSGYPYLRAFVTDSTPPSEVTNVTLSSTSTSVTLNWINPTNNSDFYEVHIYRNNVLIASTSSDTYTDSNLAASNSYQYKITTVDDYDNESAGVNASISTQPAEVTNESDMATSTSITLNWNNPNDASFKTINIYRNSTLIASTTTGQYTDTGLTPSTDYQYKITSVNNDNIESNGVVVNVTTDGILSLTAPTITSGTPTVDIDGGVLTAPFSFDKMTVSDTRNVGSGWNITVSASPFIQTDNQAGSTPLSLPTGTLTLNGIESIKQTDGSSTLPSNIIDSPIVIDNGSVKIISAKENEGVGTFEVMFPVNALSLNIDTSKVLTDKYHSSASYQSSITWTMVEGP